MNKYTYARINGRKDRIHRHIMREFLKRELEPNEHVYHVNGDCNDNSIENLIIIFKNKKEDNPVF